MEIVWTRKALEDIVTIKEFISKDSETAAFLIIEAIYYRADQLIQFPYSGPQQSIGKNKFRFLIEGHYKLIYTIKRKCVYIITVFDTRQNPSKLRKL